MQDVTVGKTFLQSGLSSDARQASRLTAESDILKETSAIPTRDCEALTAMPLAPSFKIRFSLAIARFCVAAWIGAAVLFVIVGIHEVTTPEFSTEVRDRLVLLRFPAYYVTGAVLTGLALLATAMAALTSRCAAIRFAVAALVIAGGLMAIDYVTIYTPLAAMITPPGQSRPPAFVTLHHWSVRINVAQLTACLLAAIALTVTDGRPNDSVTVSPATAANGAGTLGP